MPSEVPVETIHIWEAAVARLKKAERRMPVGLSTAERTELLEALTAVDDAWEEHISRVRAWAGKN